MAQRCRKARCITPRLTAQTATSAAALNGLIREPPATMDISLTKRASHGLTFKANYTYSKIMDFNSAILAPSAGNEPSNLYSPYYRRLNRGVGSYSLAHQFNAYYSYQLPYGNGQWFGSCASGVVDMLIGN